MRPHVILCVFVAALLCLSAVDAVAPSKLGRLSSQLQLQQKSAVAAESVAVAKGPIVDWWLRKTTTPYMSLPVEAWVSAALNDLAYKVKEGQKNNLNKPGGKKDIDYTRQVLGELKRKYNKTPIGPIINSLSVYWATWDQTIFGRDISGGVELWIGGHGSDSINDWFAQNVPLAGTEIANFLGYRNTLQRDVRLAYATQAVIEQRAKDRLPPVKSIVGWGHSMSGFKDARACQALKAVKGNAGIKISGYFYNSGGPGSMPTWDPNFRFYYEHGELLSQISLIPSNLWQRLSPYTIKISTPGQRFGTLIDPIGAYKNHGIINQVQTMDNAWKKLLYK